jgi:hypothetical protein
MSNAVNLGTETGVLTFSLPGQPGHGRPACDAQTTPSQALLADGRQ